MSAEMEKPGVVSDSAAVVEEIPPHTEEVRLRPASLIALHWLTFAILVLAASAILLREEIDGKSLRLWLLEGHRHLGLLVFALFIVRVAQRLWLGRLPATADSAPLVRFAAAATHVALYAMLAILPVLGWALSNAKGWPVHFLGLTLPNLVAEDEDLADRLTSLHVGAAVLLLALVSLHAGAALWHHFVRRDDVLRAMLPRSGGDRSNRTE